MEGVIVRSVFTDDEHRSRPCAVRPKLSMEISGEAESRRSSQARVAAQSGASSNFARSVGVIHGSASRATSRSLPPCHGRVGGSGAASADAATAAAVRRLNRLAVVDLVEHAALVFTVKRQCALDGVDIVAERDRRLGPHLDELHRVGRQVERAVRRISQ